MVESLSKPCFYTTEVLVIFMIWYTDNDGAFNYAASSDGTNWNTHPKIHFWTNLRSWDQDSIAGQVVVWDPSKTNKPWPIKDSLGTGEFDPNIFEVDNGIWGLGISTSPDGVQWTKHPNNPALTLLPWIFFTDSTMLAFDNYTKDRYSPRVYSRWPPMISSVVLVHMACIPLTHLTQKLDN